tara:strand:+ start:154 stop:498 length:345 start_codon:yes stop_codon:yes gene_type:complete
MKRLTPEELVKYPITSLNLSRRTHTMLRRKAITNCATLVRMSERHLMRTPGIGRKAIKEIRVALNQIGTDIAGAPIAVNSDDFTSPDHQLAAELITDLMAVLEKHANRLKSLKP